MNERVETSISNQEIEELKRCSLARGEEAMSSNDPIGETSVDHVDEDGGLFRTISFELDDSADELLSSPIENTEEEQSIPRELIAVEVRSTKVIASLERPICLGTFNSLPAFRLGFHLSFQRVLQGSFGRIRAVEIEITFEDAPKDATVSTGTNPTIVRFHPELYNGPVSKGGITYHLELNGQLVSVAGGPSLGAALARDKSFPYESKLEVHGVVEGWPTRNKITWTIEEDHILGSGMPRDLKLPLIVNMKESRRFSAKLNVAAHYGFKRGMLAKTFPVIGKDVVPLFFDPQLLQDIAQRGTQTGPDGRPIAKLVGNLDAELLNTSEYSSFAEPAKS